MASFLIPGDIITKVSALGAGAPDTGFYKATITEISAHPSRPRSRKMQMTFDTGFGVFDWLNTPYDVNGVLDPSLKEKQWRGMVGATKSVFESAGFTNEQMKDGVTDDWLIGREVVVEWHSATDLGAKYGELQGYLTAKTYEKALEEGRKPFVATAAISQAGSGPAPGIAPASQAGAATRPPAAAPSVPSAPAPVAAAPSAPAAQAPMAAPVPGMVSLPPAPASVVN